MGHNAGGFGSMRFPKRAALDAWRRSAIRYDDYDDWIHPLANVDGRPDEPVSARLASLAGAHDVATHVIRLVVVKGLTLTLAFDDGEDGFRQDAADIAATLRGAAAFGAAGVFFFLGTAGAEREFAYELALDGTRSTLRALPSVEVEAIYDGAAYRDFLREVDAAVTAGRERASKPRKSKATEVAVPAATGSAGPVAEIDRLLGSPWKPSVGRTWRAIESQLAELARSRPTDAIAALTRWLDHPNEDVAGTAADVLLAYDDPAALAIVARQIHPTSSAYRLKTAIWAAFKSDPAHSFDALAFVLDGLRTQPNVADPRAVLVLAALRQTLTRFERPTFAERVGVPLDLPKLDTRWLDLCDTLAEVTARGVALEPQAILHLAHDPRAPDAFVRAVRTVGVPAVANAIRYLGVDVRAALEAAARDPARAGDAAGVNRLAAALGA